MWRKVTIVNKKLQTPSYSYLRLCARAVELLLESIEFDQLQM